MAQEKLGMYYAPMHDRSQDWDYMRQLNPIGVRVLDPAINVLKRIYDMLPNTILYPRYWPISENQAEYQANPIGLARKHVQFWKDKIAEYEKAGIDRARVVTVSTNEPKIWSDIDRNQNYDGWRKDMLNVYRFNLEYNLEIAEGLGRVGIKAGLLSFSVGHPANLRDAEPSYWDWAESLVSPTLKYGHNWTIHEYWPKEGPQANWGWYSGRWSHIPFDVPIVIGECGIDRFVNEPGIPQQERGWKSAVSQKEYAIQLNSYAAHLALDKRVIVAFPFLTDFASRDWASFDTADAHNEIIKEKQVSYATFLPVIRVSDAVPGNPPEQQKPTLPQSKAIYRLKWPPLTPVTSWYGGPHNGLDVGIPTGTPLYAIYDGDVAWSDVDIAVGKNYGEYIRIWHPDLGVHSFFAHLSKRVVQQGQKVVKGDLLGYSGNTGTSTGPHVHIEVRAANDDGSYNKSVSKWHAGQIDPMSYLVSLSNLRGTDGKRIDHD